MATEQQEVAESTDPAVRSTPPLTRTWIVASIVVGVMLVGWFFVAWLALDRHFIDAASESVGTAFALLLAVSVIGAVRRGGQG